MTGPTELAAGHEQRSAKGGRPRRLKLDDVLEAALAIGAHKLTMAAVAERLGVAKAVLYGYVRSREELVQLAVARATRKKQFPSDNGQSWGLLILQYGRALFEVLTMDGQLLESWLSGGQAPAVEISSTEVWLGAMTARGFTGEEAMQLLRAVTHVVMGAAASYKHEAAMRASGAPRSVAARRALLAHPAEETPLLREVREVFEREVTPENWEYALYLLLQGVVAARHALRGERPATDECFDRLPLPVDSAGTVPVIDRGSKTI